MFLLYKHKNVAEPIRYKKIGKNEKLQPQTVREERMQVGMEVAAVRYKKIGKNEGGKVATSDCKRRKDAGWDGGCSCKIQKK
jgi:hypothetical protein